MAAERFISSRIQFKGRVAVITISVSFLVMILAVAISSGFRKEIRGGLSEISGDILLTSVMSDYNTDSRPISDTPSFLGSIESLKGVESVTPVIYRTGIVKKGENIHGVLFKGVADPDSLLAGTIRIPKRLAEILIVSKGDKVPAYFVGEKLQAKVFTVSDVFDDILQTDENLMVYSSIDDLRALNGWEEGQVSALEVRAAAAWRDDPRLSELAAQIGDIALRQSNDQDDTLVATSLTKSYPQLFGWLNLIDNNVLAILVLMTVVAGFNMISGLLIMLFRSISTIGTLKTMGMSNRAISGVFLRVSAKTVFRGMLIGNVLALGLCALQGATHALTLDPANYFVSFVPVALDVPMILIADAVAFAVILLLLLIPTLFISGVDPSRTVRAQ